MILRQLFCAWLLAACHAARLSGRDYAAGGFVYAAGCTWKRRNIRLKFGRTTRVSLAFLEKDKLIDSVPGRPPSEENRRLPFH